MTDAVITEYTGTRRNDTIARFYQYGNGGVQVLDGKKRLRRLYRFDPGSDMMTERDPVHQDKVLRRLMFDRMGMLEETFSFGSRPRTFRYEDGCSRIVVREGGEYGQVGKTFTFEGKGIAETGWGRNGEIERVFIFEPGNDTITERSGGWFGNVERTITFKGIEASLFREPEAFLQFLIFSEWSASEREQDLQEQVAKIRGSRIAAPGLSPYAYTGERRTPAETGKAGVRGPSSRSSTASPADSGIDFIPDGDAPVQAGSGRQPAPLRPSSNISFDERRQGGRGGDGRVSPGRSAEISVQERFESARSSREPLSKGRSVEIPLEERFERARQDREPLSRGRSVDIPLDERFGSSRGKEELQRGGSVDIPLEERFERARSTRQKPSRGRSAEIPYSERRGEDK